MLLSVKIFVCTSAPKWKSHIFSDSPEFPLLFFPNYRALLCLPGYAIDTSSPTFHSSVPRLPGVIIFSSAQNYLFFYRIYRMDI